MEFESQFSQIASLLGDKSRSVMLWNLLDGRAYTATELAVCADISLQSASNHLSKLVCAYILTVEKQGRHRYYSYTNAQVAQVIESMASLLPLSQERQQRPGQVGITYARTCYDHLAGKAGVAITDSLIKEGMVEKIENRYIVTSFGKDWFESTGINVNEATLQKTFIGSSMFRLE